MSYAALAGLVFITPPAEAKDSPGSAQNGQAIGKELPVAVKEYLRACLLRAIPPTLYEKSYGWGHTRRFPSKIKFQGQGLHTHAKLAESEKNDGVWRKIKVTSENMPQSLEFDVRNIPHPEPGRATIEVLAAMDLRVCYDQQNWVAGARLYSGSVQARLRAKLTLTSEISWRLDKGGAILPDAVISLHATAATLSYEHLRVEHVAGVGGDGAKVLGETIHKLVQQMKPSLERDLLAKADAAIVRAVDSKEIRIGLASLMRQKSVIRKRAPTSGSSELHQLNAKPNDKH
jgi:hypothetical protein